MFSLFADPGGRWRGLLGVTVRADDAVLVLGEPGRDALLLEGVLYPDCGHTPVDLLRMFRERAALQQWQTVKGCYAGAYVDSGGGVLAFNDHAGIRDLYGWTGEPASGWAIGTDFAALARGVPARVRRLDPGAAAQYVTLGTLVNGRTFAAGIRRLPPGTRLSIRAGQAGQDTIWRYRMQPADWEMDDAVDRCWSLLQRAAARVRAATGPLSRGLLGLSGGRDSRVVARTCLDAGVAVRPFFFGEQDSDAAAVAAQLAAALGLTLRFPGRNRDFPALFEESLRFQPLADLEWCKYQTGMPGLFAGADAMLSGHLGDHLFGVRSFRAATGPEDDRELARELFLSCLQEKPDPDTAEQIVDEIAVQVAGIGGSVIQRKEGFSFHTVNMTVKQCGLFRVAGAPPHYSLFEDIDVLEAALALPDRWRLRNRFYQRMFARHLPQLAVERIRAADSSANAHKPIDAWLRGNEQLRPAVAGIVDLRAEMALPDRRATFGAAVEDMVQGTATRKDIHQFFRRLTVQAYRNRHE